MDMTPAELCEIVAAAATLPERLSDQFAPVDTPDRDTLVHTRLTRWCQTSAQGDWVRFRARLAAEGLDEEHVRLILGVVRLKDDAPLPQWAQTLELVFQVMTGGGELFAPFVTVAWQKLMRRAGTLLELLTESARTDLENHLQRRLSEIVFPTLSAASVIRSFSQMSAMQWFNLFPTYPVLARLLATITDFWVETSVQLLERVYADRDAIRATFCPSQEIGGITAITAGLADPHHHGQTVLQLTFAHGLTLFYKPRNLDLEVAWFGLLDQINQTGIALPFTLLRVLSREGYGWMERIEARPCMDSEQVDRYYYRAGMLLCLLYLFGGSDFQQENVIACADQPVFIDLETLMTPAVRGQEYRLIPRRISETVLRTHFLPSWERTADQRLQAAGGMEAIQIAADIVVGWKQRAAAVATGFRDMTHWLNMHQEVFSTALSQFEGLRQRVIFQDTRMYKHILQRSLQPQMLKNAFDREIELERLARLSCPPEQFVQHVSPHPPRD
jgi:lantibiotic modifying enzyme